MRHEPRRIDDVEACVDHILATVGKKIVFGMPLGLGKPNPLANALYRRAKADPSIDLEILTALSLEKPHPGSDFERRFMGPFLDRLFGDYEELEYLADIRRQAVPRNIRVCEFFFKSGSFTGNAYAQQHYISTNYTFVARDLNERGVNVLAQLVARRGEGDETRYSLSCNPEVTLDLMPSIVDRRLKGEKLVVIGMVHPDLPYMVNDAEVSPQAFDVVIDSPQYAHRLFGTPNMAVTTADFMIGLHASTLVRDGGTLQIGIGALGDAIVHALRLRHHHNDVYHQVIHALGDDSRCPRLIDRLGGLTPFREGLFGASEMFVSGFWELMKAGVLTRRVYDHAVLQELLNTHAVTEQVDRRMLELLRDHGGVPVAPGEDDVAMLRRFGILREEVELDGDSLVLPGGTRVAARLDDEATLAALAREGLGARLKGGMVMHGGFFLGPQAFYAGLRDMPEEERAQINMTHISYINALYGEQKLKSLQRRDARLMNTVFTATLMGAGVSDGTADGQVVSGVGGQYNFVAMAHELPGARSILMLRAVRTKGDKASSNIVWSYGHTTIPRHLRDIFITEYGIADLRGKTDAECIAAMLKVTDSRFQPELLAQAKEAGKIAHDYEIPEAWRHNTPERLEQLLAPFRAQGHFPAFPFGHDFTAEELVLGKALKRLKAATGDHLEFLKKLLSSTTHLSIPEQVVPYLQRMGLENPQSMKEKLEQLLLVDGLCEELGIER